MLPRRDRIIIVRFLLQRLYERLVIHFFNRRQHFIDYPRLVSFNAIYRLFLNEILF